VTAAARTLAAALVLVAAVACGGGATPAARPATTPTTGGDLDKAAAIAWTTKVAGDADIVQLTVRSLEHQLAVVNRYSPPRRADLDRLALLSRRGHAALATATVDMTRSEAGGGSSAQDMVVRGVTELRDALGAFDDYIAHGGHASLTATIENFATGCSDWNSAVIILWSTAGLPPPTVPRL
jgi:hypothetical protein